MKRTTIQSKFKDNSNNSDSPFTASYLLLLSTRICFLLFSSQTTDLYCDSTPSQPSLSTDLSLLLQINKKFETQEHLQPTCMREEPEKKMELNVSNAVCDLCRLVDVREIDDCRFEALFYLLIFGFWYYKIIVAVKIGNEWKEMEGNWGFLVFAFRIKNSKLNSPKILSFEFLCVCLCESLVNSDGSEYLVLYLDHMNESLDFCSGWICVVFAICRCSSLQLSLRVRLKVWIFTQIR